jgi:hypothetical protein
MEVGQDPNWGCSAKGKNNCLHVLWYGSQHKGGRPTTFERSTDTHSVWMLLKESNVPFASDWMLLSYSDLQQMHSLVVTISTLSHAALHYTILRT